MPAGLKAFAIGMFSLSFFLNSPYQCWKCLYEYSGDEKFKDAAMIMTSRIEKEKNNTSTHDLGFMLYNSYGNGLRLTNNESYEEVLLTAAKSLSTRYRPNVGCIQSWGSSKKWQCSVIIDNMMNLELLTGRAILPSSR